MLKKLREQITAYQAAVKLIESAKKESTKQERIKEAQILKTSLIVATELALQELKDSRDILPHVPSEYITLVAKQILTSALPLTSKASTTIDQQCNQLLMLAKDYLMKTQAITAMITEVKSLQHKLRLFEYIDNIATDLYSQIKLGLDYNNELKLWIKSLNKISRIVIQSDGNKDSLSQAASLTNELINQLTEVISTYDR